MITVQSGFSFLLEALLSLPSDESRVRLPRREQPSSVASNSGSAPLRTDERRDGLERTAIMFKTSYLHCLMGRLITMMLQASLVLFVDRLLGYKCKS